jgi:hypothetical protein
MRGSGWPRARALEPFARSLVTVVQRRMPMSFAGFTLDQHAQRVSGHGNDHLPVTLFEGKW